MITDYATEVLAPTRGAELRAEARTARLAALARCCRPSAAAHAARRVAAALTRLGDGVRRGRPAASACCAPA